MARVYLICDQQDEAAVEPLEDYLYEQGIEVSLPDFEQDEKTISQIHWQNLQDCDAALIYYGQVKEPWFRGKVRDLRKARAYDRTQPMKAQGIYRAGPENDSKARRCPGASGSPSCRCARRIACSTPATIRCWPAGSLSARFCPPGRACRPTAAPCPDR